MPPSPQGGGRFRLVLASASPRPADLDGDGTPDIVVGAPGHDGQGAAHVFDGDLLGAGRADRTLTDPAPVAGGRFGSSRPAGAHLRDGQSRSAPRSAHASATVRTLQRRARRARADDLRPGRAVRRCVRRRDRAARRRERRRLRRAGGRRARLRPPGGARTPAALYILTSKGPAGAGAPAACVSTGGGPPAAAAAAVAAASEVTPPGDEDTVVIARVLRRLVLEGRPASACARTPPFACAARCRLRRTVPCARSGRRSRSSGARPRAAGSRRSRWRSPGRRASSRRGRSRAHLRVPGPGLPDGALHGRRLEDRQGLHPAQARFPLTRAKPLQRGSGDRAPDMRLRGRKIAVFADSPLVPSKCRDALGGGSI